MSTQDQIGKLEDLLARVKARAAMARTQGNGAAHAAPAQAAAPSVAPASRTPTPVAPAPLAIDDLDSIPPITRSDGAGEYGEAEFGETEVEISTETVEVDIDIDEPMAEPEPMQLEALESGAQPVAYATTPPEELEMEDDIPMATPAPAQELEEVTQTTQIAAANEIEEPTPSSSRRPIAGEEAATEAYEAESAPRHTPPPESGKQVAAPSAHPPSRKPSAPPPSLEGHTLVGGWREPGLGPSVGIPGGSPVRVPGPPPQVPVQAASGTRLSPDVTRPQIAGGADVATFAGAPPVGKPSTLGELLDMTLGL